jgi:AraC-like DNA-binding protein
VSTKVARQLLEDAGTTMRNPGPSRPHELDDQAWLSAAYSNASLEQIAAELGCSPTTVARALERCGITRRRSGPR